MGVYVKGMEMPKDCCECYFSELSNCGLICALLRKVIPDFDAARLEGCPLVEARGDLIDREAALDAMAKEMIGTGFYSRAKDALQSVPAVVEAKNKRA